MNDKDLIFIEKANLLLDKSEKLNKESESVDYFEKSFKGEFDEIICDVVHLIYSYDKDLPVLKEILEYKSYKVDLKETERVLRYVVKYINDIKVD